MLPFLLELFEKEGLGTSHLHIPIYVSKSRVSAYMDIRRCHFHGHVTVKSGRKRVRDDT